MLLRLILVELRKRVGGIAGWGIGMAAFAMMIMGVVPQLADQLTELNLEDIAIYQAFGINQSMDSAIGLLGVYLSFFGLMLAIYGVFLGSNALAGEEDSGTLEIQLAMPVKRVTLVLAKAIAIVIALILVAALTFAGFAVMLPSIAAISSELKLIDLFNISWEMLPLAFLFAMLALLVGAWLPGRSTALGVSIAVLVASYLFNNLGATVRALQDYLPLQPFYYYNGATVLQGELDIRRVITLLVAGAIALLLALYAFQRRDVTVGNWPWQRARVS